MAKMTDFTTPTGVKGNIFDLTSMWNMILGTAIFLFVFSTGQNLAKRVSDKVPAVDTRPDQPWSSPVTVTKMQKEVL
jgi:hypothetical protein